METNAQRRIRKLKTLAESVEGGLRTIAQQSGLNAVSLEQVIKGVPLPKKRDGTSSARNLGNKAAEQIEDGMGLGRGWFDADDSAGADTSSDTPVTPLTKLSEALATISSALERADPLTRLSLEPLFQLWAKQPEEANSITERIEELLTKYTESSQSVDDVVSRTGASVKGRQRQPGFVKHGTSDRAKAPARKSRGH